jgi:hypothetical protein
MDWSPDRLSDRRMSAGDEGNNDADFVDGQTASPLRRVTGGLVGGFQEINFCGFETFRDNGRVLSVIARSASDEAIHVGYFAAQWIASRSLSSGAHSRDPLARNDGMLTGKTTR